MQEKDRITIEPIAYAHTDFTSKFAIPRQPGIVKELKGKIVLEKEYRKYGIFRRLESFSHIWLIWGFSENFSKEWHSTVRPPRLGGDTRIGVLASRSPFRPNHLGMSAVKLEEVKDYELIVSGIDLLDQTPIYDIKPYIPYSDCIDDASEGYAKKEDLKHLDVIISKDDACKMPSEKIDALKEILAQDPRPAYQHDENRQYGFTFAGYEIKFFVKDNTVTVISIEKMEK